MKTAITSSGDNLLSSFNVRFGRAKYFCIYNEENGDISFIKNENANQRGGAGTKAVEKLIKLGVKKVISGDFGTKSSSLLEQANIQMVILSDGDKTIQEVIDFINAYH